MKNIKENLISLVSMFSVTILLISSLAMASQGTVNFELFNKSTTPIGVRIVAKGVPNKTIKEIIQPNVQLKAMYSEDVTLYIFDVAQRADIKDNSPTLGIYFIATPSITGISRTKYLTWNPTTYPERPLYPQTGTWGGYSGKTQSGLALDKNINVNQNEITSSL